MVEDRKCLVQWHDYSHTIQSAMQNIRMDKELLDCTLACEGYTVRAHKLVLAASSQYFRKVFKDFPCKHPTILLEGIKMAELINMLQFMYSGKIFVNEDDVVPLMLAAASLSVDGLSYVTAAMSNSQPTDSQSSSGYEGSPLDLNEETVQENKSIRSNENILIEEKDESNSPELQNSHVLDPQCLSPSSKRIKIVTDKYSVKEDFSRKSSENNSKVRLPLENANQRRPELDDECMENENLYPDEGNGQVNSPNNNIDVVNDVSKNGDPADLPNDINPYKDVNSPENTDSDCGPPSLPPNHPAVMAAATNSNANGIKYAAALLATGIRPQMMPSGFSNANGISIGQMNNSLPVWPKRDQSSPPPICNNQEYIHPIGHSVQDMQATLEQYQRKLAFHEPRPCPTCKRMYRDAATLRTHIAIMHFEGKEPFACTCGSLFRTKYDMYQHKKNGHR